MNNFVEKDVRHFTFSEEKYRCVFDTAGDAMFLIEKETGQILEANQTAVVMYGFEKSEFCLMKNTDLSVEPDKTAQALKAELSFAPVRYHKKKNGIIFPVEVTAAYYKKSDGIVSVVNIRDISERLKIENVLLDKNKELEQLIYITSHDFRTPLLNITGYSNELKNIINEIKNIVTASQNIESNAVLNKYFKDDIPDAFCYIDVSCKKMNILIDGLLKISRLRQVELNYQRIDMIKLCNTVALLHGYTLKEKNISVETGLLPDCFADLNLMNQVFSNLFANAVKFIKNDISGLIKITGFEDAGIVTYCIEDNGIGLPQGSEKSIFDMFSKLHPEIEGDGIGLTIVWKIIERHHGKIWVESENGNGCRFYIQLPKSKL